NRLSSGISCGEAVLLLGSSQYSVRIVPNQRRRSCLSQAVRLCCSGMDIEPIVQHVIKTQAVAPALATFLPSSPPTEDTETSDDEPAESRTGV
ncbi:hypothetical protein, partial [Microbacterium lacticum]|uniref:hypothetical protein n=1 Tax=Microbacterium lacticum TaxID=33885 RepID=UPI001F569BFF